MNLRIDPMRPGIDSQEQQQQQLTSFGSAESEPPSAIYGGADMSWRPASGTQDPDSSLGSAGTGPLRYVDVDVDVPTHPLDRIDEPESEREFEEAEEEEEEIQPVRRPHRPRRKARGRRVD